MKIVIETEDHDNIDYCLTSFENSAIHVQMEYELVSDDNFIQAKYGQEKSEEDENV